MMIKVDVDGRPPRKSGSKSLWDSNEARRVICLRQNIRKRQKELKNKALFKGRVKIRLEIRAPIISDVKIHEYVGDIDGFVAGVCDTIQPAHYNVKKWHEEFNDKPDIDPKLPMLICNDAQVVKVDAKKIECKRESYTLVVEDMD